MAKTDCEIEWMCACGSSLEDIARWLWTGYGGPKLGPNRRGTVKALVRIKEFEGLSKRERDYFRAFTVRAQNTPLAKYRRHRASAQGRGIQWEFTFREWWVVWFFSGHWDQRGTMRGEYVMSRRGDKGPYSTGNVFIQTCSQNSKDAMVLREA